MAIMAENARTFRPGVLPIPPPNLRTLNAVSGVLHLPLSQM
jgi:hypothetical protein